MYLQWAYYKKQDATSLLAVSRDMTHVEQTRDNDIAVLERPIFPISTFDVTRPGTKIGGENKTIHRENLL